MPPRLKLWAPAKRDEGRSSIPYLQPWYHEDAALPDDQDFNRFLDVLSFYIEDDRLMKFSSAKLLKASLPQRTTPVRHPLVESLAYVPNFHFTIFTCQVEIRNYFCFANISAKDEVRYLPFSHSPLVHSKFCVFVFASITNRSVSIISPFKLLNSR